MDGPGHFPLHAAVARCCTDIVSSSFATSELVSMLMSAGADPAVKDGTGTTPLHMACSKVLA